MGYVLKICFVLTKQGQDLEHFGYYVSKNYVKEILLGEWFDAITEQTPIYCPGLKF